MKYLFVLIFLFISFLPSFAQKSQRIIPDQILSVALSADESLLACNKADSVYIYEVKTLALIKKWAHKKEMPVILGFHPSNNNIILLQQQGISNSRYSGGMAAYGASPKDIFDNYQLYDRKYNELPEDSVIMWDISKSAIANISSGSFYFQFGTPANSMIAVNNKVYPYESEGKTVYSASRSEIQSLNDTFRFKSIVNKTCRKLVIDPSLSCFAASWKDGYKKDTLFFSLSIQDFKTHQVIFEVNRLTEPVTDLSFSMNGKYLAFSEARQPKDNGSLRIIDTKTGQLLREINEAGGAKCIRFSNDGKQLYYLDHEGRNWFTYEIESSRISQKVWPQLISLDEMIFTRLSNAILIVAGEVSSFVPGQVAGKTKINQLKLVSLKDLSLYTKTTEGSDRLILDSSNYTMFTNDVVINNSRPELNFGNDRKYFTRVDNKTQLQVWNSLARKKIIQISFEAEIKASTDNTGKNILVVEKNGQRTYDEFRLHLLSLSNGMMRSSGQMEKSKTVMDGSYYMLQLISDPLQYNTWYALDGSNSVWQLEGKDFSMKKILTLEKSIPVVLQISTEGIFYVLGKNKQQLYDVLKCGNNGEQKQIVNNSTKSNMQIVNDSVWMWNYSYSGDSTIEVWSNGTKGRTISIPGKIQKVDAIGISVLVHYELRGKNQLAFFENGKSKETVSTDLNSVNCFLLKPDEILAENEGFSSLVHHATRKISWTVKTPLMLEITNFDVSSNGNFILLDNRIIDLKQIQQWDIDKYSPACLLQDTVKLNWVEIYREGAYGERQGGFTIQKFTEGKKDTVRSKTWIKEPKTGDNFYFKHDQLRTSSDKQWAISYTMQGMLNAEYIMAPPMLWDLNKMEGRVIPVNSKYYSLVFSGDGKRIICSSRLESKGDDQKFLYDIQVYQVSPLKQIRNRKNIDLYHLDDPKEGEQFSLVNNGIDWLQPDGDSLKVKKEFFSKQNLKKFIYSPGTKKLIAGSTSGNLMIWNVNGSSSPLKIFPAHSSPIIEMMMRGNRVYSLAENGEIGITSLDEDTFKVMVRTMVKDDELRIAMNTPEGYYRVDPDLMNDLHFVKNGEVYPLSSFELQGNRPDKVYEAIGLADTAFISALKESWKNRIRKAGFDPEKPIDNNNRPLVSWDRSSLPVFTSDSLLALQFQVSNTRGNLNNIYIRVNGVPAGNKKGIQLAKGQKNTRVDEKIPLSTGNNYISVVAVNDLGIESLEQSFDIQYEGITKRKSRLIYVGIGVSHYADSSMDLKFASKDVQDISERLQYYVDSVEVHTLVDGQATRDNILALKKYLKQTNTDDLVMISFSGHGMIEQDKGFFFAPHDMNFSKPSLQGLSMEMIDDLLDDIPARKRLLLLDACHSGEQWEGGGATGPLPDGVSAIKPRGGVTSSIGEGVGANKQLGYLLMKELFSDFSRGNGAFMISAAASNEFAFEGEEWNNGVFTKSLLDALRELRNKSIYGTSSLIKVHELRKLIYEKVSALTNGRQNPTSRQENGWWNWSF